MTQVDRSEVWARTLDLLCGLWPDFDPTPDQISEWREALWRAPWPVIDQAFRRHFRESRWKRPELPRIIELITVTRGATTPHDVHEAKRLTIAEHDAAVQADREATLRALIALPLPRRVELREIAFRVAGDLIGGSKWRSADPVHWTDTLRGLALAAHRTGATLDQYPEKEKPRRKERHQVIRELEGIVGRSKAAARASQMAGSAA